MKIKKLMLSTLAAALIGTTAFAGAAVAEDIIIAPNPTELGSFVEIGTGGALASPLIVIGSNRRIRNNFYNNTRDNHKPNCWWS